MKLELSICDLTVAAIVRSNVIEYLVIQRVLGKTNISKSVCEDLEGRGLLEKTETGYAITDLAEDAIDVWLHINGESGLVKLIKKMTDECSPQTK